MTDSKDIHSLAVGRLPTQIVGSRVFVYEEVGSTNERGLELDEDGAVIVADLQTAGRGRHGRSWHSMPGKGLWVTVVLRGNLPGLSFAIPLAIRDALAPLAPVQVKWPNDLLLDKKKLCGILVEQRGETIAAGFGINVNHEADDFPEDIQNIATSLRIVTGKSYDRSELLREILIGLDARVISLRNGGLANMRTEWTEACNIVGKTVTVGDMTGMVEGVDNEGGLVIDRDGTRHLVVFGDMITVEKD